MVAELPIARGRHDVARKGEQTHWNLAHHLLAHHPWPYYRSNRSHSLRTRSPTSGPSRGIVSRRTRLTIRLKPVRTARKHGSTWARSFSRRLGARRFCISSGIVIIHGRFDVATSSFRPARRFNVGMAASSSARYGPAFLHRSRIPLAHVDLSTVAERGRRSLLETNAMQRARCESFCLARRNKDFSSRRAFLSCPSRFLDVPSRAMWSDTRPAVDHLTWPPRHADRPRPACACLCVVRAGTPRPASEKEEYASCVSSK
jgi:hypothetical protein